MVPPCRECINAFRNETEDLNTSERINPFPTSMCNIPYKKSYRSISPTAKFEVKSNEVSFAFHTVSALLLPSTNSEENV